MATVDFFASHIAYAEHLLPIWWALEPEERGTFYATSMAEQIVRPEVGRKWRRHNPPSKGPLTVLASARDMAHTGSRNVALVNHGAGQSYNGSAESSGDPSYSGGRGRGKVRLFLEPGRVAADQTRAAKPKGDVAEVGPPKMDPWIGSKAPNNREPVIAVSFHWPCAICPEAGWAWPEFAPAVKELAKDTKLLGHAHPRVWRRLKPWYESIGVEPVQSFSEVLERADIYVADNSSTIFEFALLDRPVVLMNATDWRRDVEHGLRFWEHSGIGLNADESDELKYSIEDAILTIGSDAWRQIRHDHLQDIYTIRDGTSAFKAAQAIREVL